MKILAQTLGTFQLLDNLTGDLIPASRPAVITKTSFTTARAAIEQVRILAELKDDATDAEFRKHWEEAGGDYDLAVQSFLSAYGADPAVEVAETEAQPAPSKRRGRAS
jgi:hypothetical protein